MIDVRENILVRLTEIVATIPSIKSAQRNNVEITEDQLPAAIVFDGDEETDDQADMSMRPSNKPIQVRMMPEIVIAQQDNEVGSDLSALRRELIKRVLTDTDLNEQIVKTGRNGNGVIRYIGLQTDLGWMRSLHGALRVMFLLKYTLRPDDL
jgi:hypothetical protein